jgi:hypothetical protein
MSEQPHGPTQHHQPEKAGNPEKPGFLKGNQKWYLVAGLAVVAVLVFVFVRKSNSNSSTTGNTTSTTGLDPTTTAELQSALQSIASGGYGYNAYTSPPSANTGGTTTSSTPTASVPSTAVQYPIGIAIPNGMGGWENAEFPTTQSESQYFTNIGASGGHYPTGLNPTQFSNAVTGAGGIISYPTTTTS